MSAVWADAAHASVSVHTVGDEVDGSVITQDYAVVITGDDQAGIEGTRDQLIKHLRAALNKLQQLPAKPTPMPLGVCGCGSPVMWSEPRQAYIDASDGERICPRSPRGLESHTCCPDNSATFRAEHENALHVREPEPSCPWCVIDVAAAGEPSRVYGHGEPDPTYVPARLRQHLGSSHCPATRSGYCCTWRDPIHVSRGVPHVAGDGRRVRAVWGPE